MAYPIQTQYNPMTMGPNFMSLPRQRGIAQFPTMTPEQQNILSSLLSQGISGMGNLPSSDFSPIRKMYESQFQQQVVPGLTEQFAGMGSGNMRSSAFQQALGSAGAGLSERLAGMEQQFNMQNRQSEIGRLMSMLQLGLRPQYENTYIPRQPGLFENLLGNLGQSVGPALQLASAFM